MVEVFFAHSVDAEPTKTIEVAPCVVLEWNVVAPTGYRVTRVVGAFIAVVAHAVFAEALRAEAGRTETGEKAFVFADRSVVRRHATPTGIPIANVVDAFIAVVFANDANAKVAHAVHADAGSATERAVRSVLDRVMVARGAAAVMRTMVVRAWVGVAAVHPFAGAIGPLEPVAARNERNQQENEDPKKSDQVNHAPRLEAHCAATGEVVTCGQAMLGKLRC